MAALFSYSVTQASQFLTPCFVTPDFEFIKSVQYFYDLNQISNEVLIHIEDRKILKGDKSSNFLCFL